MPRRRPSNRRMTPGQFWDAAVIESSARCFDTNQAKEYCARLAAEYADELVKERMKRLGRRTSNGEKQ